MRFNTPAIFCLFPGITIVFACLLSLLISAALSAENANPDNLTAREIIERMEMTYANSRTYSDSGVVKIIFRGSVNRTVEKPFTTAFIRPDHFRYEFKETNPYGRDQVFIIHLNGKDVQAYWDVQHDMEIESLDRAVASATGVSNGSAITVPAMLLPNEITWRRAIRFSQPKRIEDDVFDNAECFRIQDLVLNSTPTILWIDKNTFLLRKIYREQEFGDFHTQETTLYKPNMNHGVPNELLEFKPPKQTR